MKDFSAIPFSILDLSPIVTGGTPARALRQTLNLAQHAETWGYRRFWVAEHHNMPGIASAATSVVIGFIAAGTERIRVGSGGVMLPNHAPLVIAEQFGTLETLYPGRIDLGLGRAPGGDQPTARALRRNLGSSDDTFPQDLLELQAYFQTPALGQKVKAVPGSGLDVPIYLLGSSDFSARLAAELGLPFAFASHFAPAYLHTALDLYRANFKPSSMLEKPHAIVAMNVVAADTDQAAQRLFTSHQLHILDVIRGEPKRLPPPVDTLDHLWNSFEEAQVNRMTQCSAVGSPETVAREVETLIRATEADEIIASAFIYDEKERLHSYELWPSSGS